MQSNESLGRNGWKRVLASMVVGLSVGSTAFAEQARGRGIAALLERFDVDGDGALSPSERQQMRSTFRQQNTRRNLDAAVPQTLKPLYRCTFGAHAVESIATTKLGDSERENHPPLRITFPKSTGRFPVIVFSHGAFGSKDSYDLLVQHWASYGYIIIQPTHGDSRSLLSPAERQKLGSAASASSAFAIETRWQTRAEEIALTINSLAKLDSLYPALRGKVDHAKIGVGGHSDGGDTMQLVGVLDPVTDLKLDGVKALLMLSPPGPDEEVTSHEFRAITAPTLVVTGTDDQSPLNGKGNQWRLKMYDLIPSERKHLLLIEGAKHHLDGIAGPIGQFTNEGTDVAQTTCVRSATTAFWDAYLKSDRAAMNFLNSNQIQELSERTAELTSGDTANGSSTSGS